jgi:hypothetical protein
MSDSHRGLRPDFQPEPRVALTLTQLIDCRSEVPPSPLANLRISLYDSDDHEISDERYGKVVTLLSESPPAFLVHFTSIPPEAETFLQSPWAPP